MNGTERINNKLNFAAESLNEIAEDISKSEFPYVRAEVENIGKALAAIFDIQKTIYTHNPHLVPEHLKEKSRYPEWNREFAKLLIQNESLLSKNNPTEAVILTEQFIESEPPKEFLEMANSEIKRIKALFKL